MGTTRVIGLCMIALSLVVLLTAGSATRLSAQRAEPVVVELVSDAEPFCTGCHQLGDQATREIPAVWGVFNRALARGGDAAARVGGAVDTRERNAGAIATGRDSSGYHE